MGTCLVHAAELPIVVHASVMGTTTPTPSRPTLPCVTLSCATCATLRLRPSPSAPAQILPMDLATAPSPKNKAIQLKELPSHRAIARTHGHYSMPLMVAGVAGGAAAHLPRRAAWGCAPRGRTRLQPGRTAQPLQGPRAAAAHGRESAEPRPDAAVPRVRRPVLNRLADLDR